MPMDSRTDLLLISKRDLQFKVEVTEMGLHVDKKIALWLRQRNIVSARGYLSLLKAAPDSFGKEFKLTDEQVLELIFDMFLTLKGHIPDDVLEFKEPRKVTYGAVKPG